MNRRTTCTIVLAVGLALGTPLETAGQQPPRARSIAGLEQLSEHFEALSRRVSGAVVEILASGYQPLQQGDAPGSGLLTRRQVGGSGVILDPDGYIVTNLHVIEGAERVRVRLPFSPTGESPAASVLKPQGKVVGARIIGLDRETDLAVLKVEERGLPHLVLGDSDELETGQLVFAFGNPLGLENSVSMGIVSAVARQLRPEDPMIYIQTDATINPGNSGGPLVNARGEVVGINTMILSQSGGSEGIGFAAPSDIVRNVYEQIRAAGYVRRGVIGVHAQTITQTLAAGLGLERNWGVILGDVYPGGPAHAAGLRAGDIVLSLDGKVIENGRQLDVNIYQRQVGDMLTLRMLRSGEEFSARIPVVERPDDANRFSLMVTPERNLISRLGILAVDLTAEVSSLLPTLRTASGVVVAARAPDATYGKVALAPGDVIHAMNGRPVGGLAQFRSEIEAVGFGEPVVLHVERRGQLQYLAFELE